MTVLDRPTRINAVVPSQTEVPRASYRSGVAEPPYVEEMTLRDYASVVWRRKWLVILPAVLTALVAAVLTLSQTSMYSASADVLVRLPPTANSLATTGSVMSPRLIENELETASGSALQSQVRQIIGAEPTLSVSSSENSDVFRFTATSSNPDNAAFAANTYAAQYIERQASALIDEYTARAEVLLGQLEGIESGDVDPSRRSEYERELEDLAVSTELARTSGATLIDAATPPGAPYEPNPTRTVMLALVVGLLLGLGAAFLVDYLDTSLKDEDDLVRASGFANLAVIPLLKGSREGTTQVITRDEPFSPSAEAYRNLRTAVRFMALDRQLKLIQVTSPRPGDGKTTTASNLAVAAARSGQRVVLIDCDLRKPQVHAFFGLDNDVGFTTVLLGESTLPKVAQRVHGEGNLLVVTSGPLPPDPSELLAGESVQQTLGRLGEGVDLIILDSPPVLPVSDPLVLASVADGVILVVSGTSTDSRQVSRAVDRLLQVDAPVLGTVFNGFDPNDGEKYTYGYAEPPEAKPEPTVDANTSGDAVAEQSAEIS
jgi:succinoglycan biosynthesis transport protein ExoP